MTTTEETTPSVNIDPKAQAILEANRLANEAASHLSGAYWCEYGNARRAALLMSWALRELKEAVAALEDAGVTAKD